METNKSERQLGQQRSSETDLRLYIDLRACNLLQNHKWQISRSCGKCMYTVCTVGTFLCSYRPLMYESTITTEEYFRSVPISQMWNLTGKWTSWWRIRVYHWMPLGYTMEIYSIINDPTMHQQFSVYYSLTSLIKHAPTPPSLTMPPPHHEC